MARPVDREYLRRFGDRVRSVREKRGYSQVELAKRAGVNKETVNRMELGGNIGIQTVYKVADALEVRSLILFHDPGDAQLHNEPLTAEELDLIGHGRDLESGLPQDVGGPLDVPASARVLSLLQDLVAAIAEQETQTSKMREFASRLLDIVAAGPEGDAASGDESARGDGDRKAG